MCIRDRCIHRCENCARAHRQYIKLILLLYTVKCLLKLKVKCRNSRKTKNEATRGEEGIDETGEVPSVSTVTTVYSVLHFCVYFTSVRLGFSTELGETLGRLKQFRFYTVLGFI